MGKAKIFSKMWPKKFVKKKKHRQTKCSRGSKEIFQKRKDASIEKSYWE